VPESLLLVLPILLLPTRRRIIRTTLPIIIRRTPITIGIVIAPISVGIVKSILIWSIWAMVARTPMITVLVGAAAGDVVALVVSL